MNHLDSLTTWEKIMNMAKLGIVSRAGNYFSMLGNPQKQRAGDLLHYTLCVFQDKARRNGSRYSFAFDIPAISGRALFSVGKLARKVAVLVPLQLILISESDGVTVKTYSMPFWLWFTGRFLGVRNYSTLRNGDNNYSTFCLTSTKNGFSLSLGGCHE